MPIKGFRRLGASAAFPARPAACRPVVLAALLQATSCLPPLLPRLCPGMVQPPWRQEPDFGQALERAGHALVTVTLGELDGGRRSAFLLVFGGRRGNTLFADVLAFDVARREWSVWCERWPSAPRRCGEGWPALPLL